MAALTSGPVAIFPWGEVIEEFLDPLGLSADDFAQKMAGGWLFGYVAALQARGRGAVIVCASEATDRPRRLIHAETGAPIWLVPGRRSGGGRTRSRPSRLAVAQWARTPFAGFGAVLRREGCSALLIQDYEHPRFDALVLLGKLHGLPVHASFQGGDVTLSPVEARVRGASLRACHGLIVASQRERERIAASYGLKAGRVHDIPNPLDTSRWRAGDKRAARQALGVPQDAFLVANHGRIDIQRKGLDVLAEAWASFAAARPDAELVMIGSGQDQAAFARITAGLPQIRRVDTYVTDPSLIRRWLSAADAYITLSRVEGMPVAPLEALACGLPMVASDAHGLPDILALGEISGGVLVRREDAPAAAAALRRLYDDPGLRRRLSTAARENVEHRYSIGAVGEGLERALYADLGAREQQPRLRPALVSGG